MNTRYDNDIDLDLDGMHSQKESDREISLGTSTVLGIFFALAIVCAVFFGFGYSMGRRSAQPLVGTAQSAAVTTLNSAKPSPESLIPAPASSPDENPANTAATDSAASTPDTQSAAPADLPAKQPAAQPVSLARTAAPPAITAPPAPPGSAAIVVQVAAVSHQEDADMLLSALRKRGYTVAIHQVPQDKLLHVQLGPFASKKDADAMRDRLLSDGYNPIVK